jgi:large subunit ribosomal protein L3
MTGVINQDGEAVAVTLLSASPNVITQIKNDETDGYQALQLGFEEAKKTAKPQAGHFKQAKTNPRIIREFRIDEITEDMKIGEKLGADLFNEGDVVDVTGISKGKGFAGTIKRHNFHRGPKSHGGRSYRRPGSIGSMFPQRIRPGKKMAGHMGHERRTVKRLKIALVDKDLDVLGVTGAVPGPRKGIVMVKESK